MSVPEDPKIYHIVHLDRLSSIIETEYLLCDAEVASLPASGTRIGMDTIKSRRLNQSTLASHPDLKVGDCVPFYFCPRSVMLYVIHKANHQGLTYRGGQDPIVHLEADLRQTIDWAETNGQRWAFTLSNAGASYFEDRCELAYLEEIDWEAVRATDWRTQREGKQAEFLVERRFSWKLVSRIGVRTRRTHAMVLDILRAGAHSPRLQIIPEWYY